MRIGVNGRFGTARRTGVQRFAAEVARRLVERDEVVLLLPRNGLVTGPARYKATEVTEGRLSGHLWEQFELPRMARRAGCDVTLHLANTGPSWGGPNVLMVHDVTPLTHPEWYGARFRAWYRVAMARTARRAAHVLTGSEWARQQVVSALGIAPERIWVARQGVAPFDAPAPPDVVQDVLRRFGLSEGYVLAVGGTNPRKNVAFLKRVIAEWRSRRQEIPELVVVGETSSRIHAVERVRSTTVPASRFPPTRRLPRVSDSELKALYTGASVFCFPSLAEGFGRPPLEAMGCGTPVLAADYGAAREVLGDAATILPLEREVWVEALERLTSDSVERAQLVESGKAWAGRYSWGQAVETVLQACQDARCAVGGARTPSTANRQPPTAGRRESRVAIVHDWLTGMRGGEKVLEALIDEHPSCEIFTLIHMPGSVSAKIEARPIHASILSRLPGVRWYYRYLLPLFPFAIERFDVTGFDLVISVSHCVAKGIRPPRDAKHVCHCLTPMRYIWDQYDSYFGKGRARWPVRAVMGTLRPWLQRWDAQTAVRVDRFVAISKHVKARIARAYGRDAEVEYPPVERDRFRQPPTANRARGDFYLTISALVPYKRVDLIVEAFNRLEYPLRVVGGGSERSRLERLAAPNVRFLGRVSDEELAELMQTCRAFVYAAREDYGIVLAEAVAAGAPVIAYAEGGAAEIVTAEAGVLYGEQTAEGLVAAVSAFERGGLQAAVGGSRSAEATWQPPSNTGP